MKILALDPSVMNRCGYAIAHYEWEGGDPKRGQRPQGALLKENWDWGFWELDGLNFAMRCNDLRHYVTTLQKSFPFDLLVCEWPRFYDSGKGHIAAQQGYTVNLAGIAMYIAGWFHFDHTRLFLYTATDWKGTVKKEVTARRFYRLFNIPVGTVDHNAVDATMMLVYHLKQQRILL